MAAAVEGIEQEMFSRLAERGYKGRVVSTAHLQEMGEEIEAQHGQGLFAEEIYRKWFGRFVYTPPESLPGVRSVILVAVPQPHRRVTFNWKGETFPLIASAGYIPGTANTNRQVKELLEEILAPHGYHVAEGKEMPLKLLAVHSGLAEYGRNNISYVEGMGSFHWLVALYSDLQADLPGEGDTWREPQMMEACRNCSACLRGCPTGAIGADRFLLRAERCLTYHNEKPGDVPFPEWLDATQHKWLVGCMHCQRVCPQNREFSKWVEDGEEFSEEETALFLQKVTLEQLPPATARKLLQSGIDNFLDTLPRNLKILLDRDRVC